MAKYQCNNCGHTADEYDLPDAKDLHMRLTPGDIYTNKECPECEAHALCFPAESACPAAKSDRRVTELRGKLEAAAPVTAPAPHKRKWPFVFKEPRWANSGRSPADPAEALLRAREMSSAYYALGAQCGIHSMIEWCGVMTEYVKMLECAHATGVDPRDVDQHHADCKVVIPEFMATYFVEKLGCQLKPFIRADRSMWRKLLEDWFEGEGQHVVCEVICQIPSVSLHATEEEALEQAVKCAMENLYTAEYPEDREDRDEAEQGFEDELTASDSICEGDYEVHLLLPTNRQR